MTNWRKTCNHFDRAVDSEFQFMDLAPDVQYFNASNGFTYGQRKYYLEDYFNTETQSHNIQSSHFSLIHHNIRIANKNVSKYTATPRRSKW